MFLYLTCTELGVTPVIASVPWEDMSVLRFWGSIAQDQRNSELREFPVDPLANALPARCSSAEAVIGPSQLLQFHYGPCSCAAWCTGLTPETRGPGGGSGETEPDGELQGRLVEAPSNQY